MAGKIELARPQSQGLVEPGRQHRLLDVPLELGALEVAAQAGRGREAGGREARSGEPRLVERRERRGASRASPPIERSPAPDVDQRDQQQDDEDQDLGEDEDRVGALRITPTGYRKTTSMSKRMNSIAIM